MDIKIILQTIFWTQFISFVSAIPWTLIFIIFRKFTLYHIKTKQILRSIQKKIGPDNFCFQTDSNLGYGYSVGKWYIFFISAKDENAWLLTTKSHYEHLIKGNTNCIKILNEEEDEVEIMEKDLDRICIYERMGDYCNPWYKKRNIDILPITPHKNQAQIIQEIIKQYEKSNKLSIYISGRPNTGKSMIGLMLAMKYKSSYCNSFKPWQPGDFLGDLYSDVEPTKDKPMILVLDEIDIALVNIHKGIPLHPKIPIAVSDKMGWNSFLDHIHWGMYPYIILIMISNKSFEFIQNLDSSYMRPGRVDQVFTMS